MPNIIKKILILMLSVALILPLLPRDATAEKAEKKLSLPYFDLPVTVQTIRVGLRSGNSALNTAKLQSRAGSGFSFGYYDITRKFRSYGYTNQNAISLRSDLGFFLNEKTYVGPYHILLSYFYSDFNTAKGAADSIGGFPALINGQYRVLVGAYANREEAEKDIETRHLSGEVYTGSGSSILISVTDSAVLLFMYDNPNGNKLAICPNGEQAETWFSGYNYRGGFQFGRNGNGITAINFVDMESYVSGVLPYEMNGNWPLEALKSQAVCARTYAINNINSYDGNGYDVRSDTYSQVYRGVTDSTATTAEAASSTAGEYARYKGSVCKVYYMSSDGGMTETGENTFRQRRAYLDAVEDPFERDIEHYNESWQSKFTSYELQNKLNKRGYDMAEIADVITEKSDAGNVIGLRFVDLNGKEAAVYNVDCYMLLGLNSLNYSVEKQIVEQEQINNDKKDENNEKDDENKQVIKITYFVFKGRGWGHNCGMSQWGAYSMAKYYGKTCRDIIDFYFSGAYIK